jgi:tetratricopeptide (TPR) repeat protein
VLEGLQTHLSETQANTWLRIKLGALQEADSQLLLSHLLPLETIPDSLRQYILSRAQNNPYYLEEIASFILESDVVEKHEGRWRLSDTEAIKNLQLPDTLRELIQSRLDRLSATQYQILAYGAVIGPNFPADLLVSVLETNTQFKNLFGNLEQLVEQNVLQFDGQHYTFTHNSVHEVVYQTLLTKDRQRIHLQVGEAIEQTAGDAVWADVEQLAYHFAESQAAERAMPYLIQAGYKSKRRFANQAALDNFSRAVAFLTQGVPATVQKGELYKAMGDVYQQQGDYDEALKAYQNALAEEQSVTEAVEYTNLIGQVWLWKGDLSEAQIWLEKAFDLAEANAAAVPETVCGGLYTDFGLLWLRRGNPQEAEYWGVKAVAALENTTALANLAKSLNNLGGAYYLQNRWAEASHHVERALEIREQIGDLLGLAGSLSNLGVLYSSSDNWQQAIYVFERSIQQCEDIGAMERTLSNAHNNIAYIYLNQGKLLKAKEHLLAGLKITEETGAMINTNSILNNLSLAYLGENNLRKAKDYLNRSIKLNEENNDFPGLMEALWHLAQVQFAEADLEAVSETCNRGLQLAENANSTMVEGGLWRTLALNHIEQNRLTEADYCIKKSLTLFEASNTMFEINYTKLVKAKLAYYQDNLEQSRHLIAEIQPLFEHLKAKPALAELETLAKKLN